MKKENKKNLINGAIEEVCLENYTVGEVISILKKFPKDYQFMFAGTNVYEIWVDHDNGMVSIDDGKFIKEEIEKLKNTNK